MPRELKPASWLSVIADIGSNLAAKHPIGPARVHQDHRQQHKCADKKEGLGALGGRRFPQREMVGNDHREEADRDPDIREDKETDGAGERQALSLAAPRARQVKNATAAVASGTGANRRMLGQANQRAAMAGCERGPNAHHGDGDEYAHKAEAAMPASRALDVALGLEDQPAGAEQPVAEEERDPGQNRERRQEIERGAENTRPLTSKPWMKAPSTTPCAKVATTEP